MELTDVAVQDSNEPTTDAEQQQEPNEIPGVVRALGDLPADAVVSEKGLAGIFHRHTVSIKRAVQRGELPPPTRLLGEPVWTVIAIRHHLEKRLETARKETERNLRKIEQLRP